jgi:hypothetical protein
VLAPNPAAAPVVKRMFEKSLAGQGLYVIAEGLTRDAINSPSAHDARNPHRASGGGAWSKSARPILLSTKPTCSGELTDSMHVNRCRRPSTRSSTDDCVAGSISGCAGEPERDHAPDAHVVRPIAYAGKVDVFPAWARQLRTSSALHVPSVSCQLVDRGFGGARTRRRGVSGGWPSGQAAGAAAYVEFTRTGRSARCLIPCSMRRLITNLTNSAGSTINGAHHLEYE